MNISRTYFFTALLAYVLLMILPSIVFICLPNDFASNHTVLYGLIFLQIPAYALLFTLFRKVWFSLKKQLKQKVVISTKMVLIYLPCLVVLFALTFVYGEVMETDDYQEQQTDLQLQASSFSSVTIVYYLCLILPIPLLEELFFRGFIYTYIAERKGWLTGLLVSSLAFGILHDNAIFFACSLSVINVLLFRYTGSLRAPIYFHCIWNTLNLLLIAL